MKYFTLGVFIFLCCLIRYAESGEITGVAQDARNLVSDVIVKIQGMDRSTFTDRNGRYHLRNIPPGEYYLIFSKGGYFSLVIPDVIVKSDDPVSVNVEMVPGDEKEYLFLEIGGIQVTAARELLSEEPETVHRISSGEIEHMQANSLANVLDLIPGNEKVSSSGLDRAQRIAVRNLNSADDQTHDLSLSSLVLCRCLNSVRSLSFNELVLPMLRPGSNW